MQQTWWQARITDHPLIVLKPAGALATAAATTLATLASVASPAHHLYDLEQALVWLLSHAVLYRCP
jgi:hypothetical protein